MFISFRFGIEAKHYLNQGININDGIAVDLVMEE
jgi:hypothetical protein